MTFYCARACTRTSTWTLGSGSPSHASPPKEAFYSKLSDEHISGDDYAHAEKVWETFGCHTLGDYHDLYNRTDVLRIVPGLSAGREKPVAGQKQAAERDYLPCSVEVLSRANWKAEKGDLTLVGSGGRTPY